MAPRAGAGLEPGETHENRLAGRAPNPADLKAEVKQELALRYHLLGMSFPAIAEILGYSGRAAAYNAYKTALDERERDGPELAVAREEATLEVLFAFLDDGIRSGSYRAIEVALKVAESRRKLLGLDAPEKKLIGAQVEFSTRTEEVTPDFVAAVLGEFGASGLPGLIEGTAEPLRTPEADAEAG